MICPGCAGYLAVTITGEAVLLNTTDLILQRPDLHDRLYADRRQLIEEWDRTDNPPTFFAWVCVQVYRVNQRKVV